MSPKDKTINLRVSTEWLAAIDTAAKARSAQVGVPISRNAFLELAALAYIERLAADDPAFVEARGAVIDSLMDDEAYSADTLHIMGGDTE